MIVVHTHTHTVAYSLSAFVEDDKQEDTQQENSDANYVVCITVLVHNVLLYE